MGSAFSLSISLRYIQSWQNLKLKRRLSFFPPPLPPGDAPAEVPDPVGGPVRPRQPRPHPLRRGAGGGLRSQGHAPPGAEGQGQQGDEEDSEEEGERGQGRLVARLQSFCTAILERKPVSLSDVHTVYVH